MNNKSNLITVILFCFLSSVVVGQEFNKTFDLSVGAAITRTRFNAKAEYLIKPQRSLYGRIDFQKRRTPDAIIGVDTITSSRDSTGFIVLDRFSFKNVYDMNLSIGYRFYSTNYSAENKDHHFQFYLDLGGFYSIKLYEQTDLSSRFISNEFHPYGLVIGTGFKYYMNNNFNLDFRLMSDNHLSKNNSYIDFNLNLEFAVGFILGGRNRSDGE